MDLYAERYDVRQAVRRNTFTGKTYNSLENISQFFARAGHAVRRARRRPRAPPRLRRACEHVIPRPRHSGKPLPSAPPPAAEEDPRRHAMVEHPKYGTGIVVRREGEGEDAKITVNFPRHGLKKLVEKYAGLKRS